MDAKEVKTHVQQLERATKENLPAQELVDILNALKKGVVPTESLLRVSLLVRSDTAWFCADLWCEF